MSGTITIKSLRNGSEEAEGAVTVCFTKFAKLQTGGLMEISALLELYLFCKAGEEVSDQSFEVLYQNGLMNREGQVSSTIKNVTLSALVLDGDNLNLISPYAQE